MPTVSLRKALYDECIRQGEDPTEYVNGVVKEQLSEEYDGVLEE